MCSAYSPWPFVPDQYYWQVSAGLDEWFLSALEASLSLDLRPQVNAIVGMSMLPPTYLIAFWSTTLQNV